MVYPRYDCGTNIALVSWDDSMGRDTFYTCVEEDGHMDCCSTAETLCSFTSLQCGLHYNVTVKALASHCNSSQTIGTSINTGRELSIGEHFFLTDAKTSSFLLFL